MKERIYEIDGRDFATLEEFFEVVGRTLIPGAVWGRTLDAFNDILRGGFGTPEGGFVLKWSNSQRSRERLGYPETVRQLEMQLARAHHTNRQDLMRKLELARNHVGPTVFDRIVDIIRDHGPAGKQVEDAVECVLD